MIMRKNGKSILRAFLSDLGHFASKWTNYPFLVLIVACGLAVGSCGQIKYVPVNTTTQVEIKDSTVLHIKDSIRYTEATRYKDLAWLGDSLKIEGQRSRMWAVADTAKGAIVGGLEEDPQEEKHRIIYRDRWKTKDSLVFQDRPVPYEVTKEVKIIPKFWIITGVFGIICMVLLLTFIGLKIYRFFKGRNILR